jgi:SAM-dependent methyltransferase
MPVSAPRQQGEPVRACPLGCPEAGAAIGELATTMTIALSRSRYTLARCGCGQLLYLSPPPSPSDLHAMYVANNQFGDEYTDPRRAASIVDYMTDALERIAATRKWRRERALAILEVGAGLAWMCRAAKARNPACATVAQDVSPEAAARCAWVDHYVQGSVDDSRLDEYAPYDVISLTHVIEHVVDPVSTLRRCLALLREGGVVFVTAPYRPRGWRDDAPDLRRFEAYSYNHVPAHVQYFAEGSMRRLTAAAGGRLAHWSHAHDGGQAFEAWIAGTEVADVGGRVPDGRVHRLARRARRLVDRLLRA